MRRAGVKLPTVTVCFKSLNVSTTVYVGSRALPSTLNAYHNFIEVRALSRSIQSRRMSVLTLVIMFEIFRWRFCQYPALHICLAISGALAALHMCAIALFQRLKRSNEGSVCHAQDFLIRLRIMKGLKQPFTILDSVSGVLKPVSPLLPSPAHSYQHQLNTILCCHLPWWHTMLSGFKSRDLET